MFWRNAESTTIAECEIVQCPWNQEHYCCVALTLKQEMVSGDCCNWDRTATSYLAVRKNAKSSRSSSAIVYCMKYCCDLHKTMCDVTIPNDLYGRVSTIPPKIHHHYPQHNKIISGSGSSVCLLADVVLQAGVRLFGTTHCRHKCFETIILT